MHRLLGIVLLSGLLLAADETPVPDLPEAGYDYRPGVFHHYEMAIQQSVTLSTLDDELAYETRLTWQFSLRRPAEEAAAGPTLELLFTRFTGRHRGPTGERAVSTAEPLAEGAEADPLLGHYRAWVPVKLTLHWDPATGVVHAVEGGEQIVANLNRLSGATAAGPGVEPPFAAAARAAYSSEALAAWWTRILALPQERDELVPLGPDGALRVRRSWDGPRFTLAAADEQGISVVLPQPQGLELSLTALEGSGLLDIRGGVLERRIAEASYQLAGAALTQGVQTTHRLQWGLRQRDEVAP